MTVPKRVLPIASELGRGSLCKAIALCSSVIALGVSENRAGMAERGLPRFFGGVGYWMKSMMLSLGDGRRILEIATGIPAIVGSCINALVATENICISVAYKTPQGTCN